VAWQETQSFTGLHGRPGKHQALYRLALEGVNGAGDAEPGLAGAGRTYAERDVALQDLTQGFALARGSRTQIRSARAQPQAASLGRGRFRHGCWRCNGLGGTLGKPGTELDHAQLDIVDRQCFVNGALVEPFECLARCLGLVARYRDAVAATVQYDVPAIRNL